MAYASKYYDPVKAHEYYMKHRVLKGYEDRYGGSRGNGTSAASNGGVFNQPPLHIKSSSSVSGSSSASSVQEHNQNIKQQIQGLRDQLNSMSKEDRALNREAIQDQIQSLREQTKGGSTSGFNQKGKEAAAYIKSQMESERDEVIKKSNKDADKAMLGDVRKLAADIKAMRESGRGVSHKEFASRIKAMLGKTKKAKIKAKRKYTSEYKQKYKDEIDKLRSDKSMYSYYDKKNEASGTSRRYSIKRASSRGKTHYKYISNDGPSADANVSDADLENFINNHDDSGLINDYNSLSREDQNGEQGQTILEMIDYNRRGVENARARLKALGR